MSYCQNAKNTLVEKYRNLYRGIVEYRKKIEARPMIISGDVEGYQRFYNFLQKCEKIN